MSGKVVNLVAEQRIIIITCSFVSYEHTISMMTRYVGNQVFFFSTLYMLQNRQHLSLGTVMIYRNKKCQISNKITLFI